MRLIQVISTGLIFSFIARGVYGQQPTLSIGHITLAPGQGGVVVVSGEINGVDAFGVTILAELVPRPDAVGIVAFTPSPPLDIQQLGDAWPSAGTFSPFDTNSVAFSSFLNGAVDDNSRFLCDIPVSYTGPLAAFPVISSGGANGTWDVVLSTSVGDSGWDCTTEEDPMGAIDTSLISGTITVTTNVPTASTWGLVVFTFLLVTAGTMIVHWQTRRLKVAACTHS